jgi:hypothetical protein
VSIAADLITYVKANSSITTIFEDNYGADSASIQARSDPSPANVREHIDGSTQGGQQVTFYARNKNPATAISQLETIRACVDKEEIALTALQVVRVQSVSTVSFVSKEDTGESIYSTTVIVDFDGKNPA